MGCLKALLPRPLDDGRINIATGQNKTLEALKIAIYKDQARSATYDAEKDFYELLAAEEQEHHLVLLDYYEYISDPAGWFVMKEHPSLDSV